MFCTSFLELLFVSYPERLFPEPFSVSILSSFPVEFFGHFPTPFSVAETRLYRLCVPALAGEDLSSATVVWTKDRFVPSKVCGLCAVGGEEGGGETTRPGQPSPFHSAKNNLLMLVASSSFNDDSCLGTPEGGELDARLNAI